MTYLNKSLVKSILKIFVNWLFWKNFNTTFINNKKIKKKLFKKLVRSFTSVYAKFYVYKLFIIIILDTYFSKYSTLNYLFYTTFY